MSTLNTRKRKPWCIVVADDHGPEFVPSTTGAAKMSPVQYCGFGDPATLLQKAMHRALRVAHPSQIAVTVREDNRARWESALWFLRPEHRFVSDTRMTSSLTTAAALLSIAGDSASNVVTILPTRCYVGDERTLSSAIDQLCTMLPGVPEGAATLGMVEIDDGVDEDYLVPCEANEGPGLPILGMARRPVGWVAQHLRQRGAMVASGILTGYAGVFAEHIHNRWPALANALSDFKAAAVGGENRLHADMCRNVPRSVLRPLRWSPPMFPQRALPVFRCGWRGLHTARAVSRISASCDDRFCEAPGPHSGKSRMSTPTGNRSTEPPTIPGKIRG
jgi:mannose-1-phosphate guanylyltransferase